MIEIRPGLFALPSRAVWIPSESCLLVCDVHLGFAWAQRRRGLLGPLVEGDAAARLSHLLDRFNPARLVVLGDLVHAPRPCAEERRLIETAVEAWASRTEIILVEGNHDRGVERDFAGLPLRVEPYWEAPGVVAAHGNRPDFPWPEGATALLGHWHPAVTIKDGAGARLLMPAFVVWPHAVVLPAFSSFSRGVDMGRRRPPELLATARVRPGQMPQFLMVAGSNASWLRRLSRLSNSS